MNIYKSIKQNRFISEFFTPIGAEPVSIKKLRVGALVRLFIITPTIFLLTFFSLLQLKNTAIERNLVNIVFTLWVIQTLTYIVINIFIIAKSESKFNRFLTYVCVAIEIGTNEIVIYLAGSFTSHACLYIIIIVSVYRVFFDYYFSFFSAVFSSILYSLIAIFGYVNIIPLTPLLSSRLQETINQNQGFALSIVEGVIIGIFTTFFTINFGMNQALKLHRYITNYVLKRYLPPQLVEKASKGELALDLPPERRIVTIMFADIVGFTSLSEQLGPESVGNLLNKYLSSMADLAFSYKATIDKFIGDGIMIVFGAPVLIDPHDQARLCVELALKFQETIPEIDENISLKTRIGINTGEVVVGNFGTLSRSDYTVIGSAVNIAARLESSCTPGSILVSEETVKLLDDNFRLESAGEFQLRGINQPVKAYYAISSNL